LVYIVRTSQSESQLSAADAVRKYKSLAVVERAFRCLKGVDLLVRPIHHRTEDHVRAHGFLCILAYYVEWHIRRQIKVQTPLTAPTSSRLVVPADRLAATAPP
jgi:transposase